jgi:hypothetical protein
MAALTTRDSRSSEPAQSGLSLGGAAEALACTAQRSGSPARAWRGTGVRTGVEARSGAQRRRSGRDAERSAAAPRALHGCADSICARGLARRTGARRSDAAGQESRAVAERFLPVRSYGVAPHVSAVRARCCVARTPPHAMPCAAAASLALAAPRTRHAALRTRHVLAPCSRPAPRPRAVPARAAAGGPGGDGPRRDGNTGRRPLLLTVLSAVATAVVAKELLQDLGQGIDEEGNAFAPLPAPGPGQAVATFAGGCFWCACPVVAVTPRRVLSAEAPPQAWRRRSTPSTACWPRRAATRAGACSGRHTSRLALGRQGTQKLCKSSSTPARPATRSSSTSSGARRGEAACYASESL